MKYLGIDYGKKKIGIAISDDSGRLAFAKAVFENEKIKTIDKITEIAKTSKVEAFIIGESKDYNGKDNPIMKEIKKFAKSLEKKSGLEIYFQPEFLSSKEAGRILMDDRNDDAAAAAIVLQSFLDKINKK